MRTTRAIGSPASSIPIHSNVRASPEASSTRPRIQCRRGVCIQNTATAREPPEKPISTPGLTPGSCALCHDLVGNVARHRVVVVELHGEAGAPLGHAPQFGNVAEHF